MTIFASFHIFFYNLTTELTSRIDFTRHAIH